VAVARAGISDLITLAYILRYADTRLNYYSAPAVIADDWLCHDLR
jgi:hypothetical protein